MLSTLCADALQCFLCLGESTPAVKLSSLFSVRILKLILQASRVSVVAENFLLNVKHQLSSLGDLTSAPNENQPWSLILKSGVLTLFCTGVALKVNATHFS